MKRKPFDTKFRGSFICLACGEADHTKLALYRAETHYRETGHALLYQVVARQLWPAKRVKGGKS